MREKPASVEHVFSWTSRERRASATSRRATCSQGAYATSLGKGEILTSIRIPAPADGHGYAYEKQKRKIGDYATAAAAVVLGRVATSDHPSVKYLVL